MKKLTCVDLFAGCGGLSLGLELAGFTPLFVSELNPDALTTYKENRRRSNPHLSEAGFHCSDVKQMVSDKAYLPSLSRRLNSTFGAGRGDLDLVVGGPPCQGFSRIGHRRSYSVDKEQLPSNHLFQDMAYVIHRLEPKAFVFENVRGLLNAKWTQSGVKGEIFSDVLQTLRAIPGYKVGWSLVHAKDYGVPQNRPRVLVVGVRNDVAGPRFDGPVRDAVTLGLLPGPIGMPPSIIDTIGDLVDPEYEPGMDATTHYPSAATTKLQKWFRTTEDGSRVMPVRSEVSEHEYSRHTPRIVAKFQAMLDDPNHKIPERFRTKKFSQRVLPPLWGKAGPTITATSLPDDYVHFLQPRTLTVREWARLQMFPDWYEFSGRRTTGGLRRAGNPREGNFEREVPKYTQIGNSVPVKLAMEVGKHLSGIIASRGKGSVGGK